MNHQTDPDLKPLQFYDANSKQVEMIVEAGEQASQKPKFKFKSNKEAYYI